MFPENISCNQAEMFSIGMTLLEAGSLLDVSILYGSHGNYEFNDYKIK
jgi:hypothetical protein